MDKNARRVRKRQLRIIAKNKIRQDSLIADYVKLKYPDIYTEAAVLYNEINIIHPSKHDLRKTYEYMKWKATITGEKVKKPKKPGPPRAKPVFHNIENPDTNKVPQNSSTCEQESDTMDSQPSTSGTLLQLELVPEQTVKRSEKKVYEDTLQLRIPLIPRKSITRPVTVEEDTPMNEEHPPVEPAVITETLQIITEEILNEPIIEPSLCEELPQDLIEKIIEELRGEPELEDVFSNVEDQFEQLGTDIDINEDYPLEDELNSW